MRTLLGLAVLGLFSAASLEGGTTCSPTTFTSAMTLPTTASPLAVTSGDVNDDGHADLVVLHDNGEIGTFIGNGDGTFGTEIDAGGSVSNPSTIMELARLNPGNDVDLVVLSYNGTDIFLGNGDGTFDFSAHYPANWYPTALAVADVNDDGNLDLLEGLNDPSLAIYLGNGDGTFDAPVKYPTTSGVVGIAAAQFFPSHTVDVAITTSANAVLVYPVTNGVLGAPAIYKVGNDLGPIVASDLNDDGILDLATRSGLFLAVLQGNGDGTFRAAREYPANFQLSWLVTRDMDGDGKPDVVGLRGGGCCGNSVGVIVPFLQQSDGSLKAGTAFLAGLSSLTLTAADFDGDSLADFATANSGAQNLSLLFGEGAGQLQAATYLPLGQQVFTLVAGDFDGDQHLDAAAIGNSYEGPLQIVQVFDGVATAGPVMLLDSYPQAAGAADFNHDDKLDLAIATNFGTLQIRLGNGDGTFQPPTSYTTGNNARAMVVQDLNADGWADVAVADSGTGSGPAITIYLNDGAGNLVMGTPVPTNHQINSLIASYFGLLDRVDLVATNGDCCGPQYDNVLLMRGNGDGTFQAPVEYATGPSPWGLAAADFNNDQHVDLAVADSNASNVAILLNDGAGGFQAPAFVAIGWTPFRVVTGDFNYDGDMDVATLNSSSANVSLLLGTGDGGFQAPVTYLAPGGGNALLAATFSGKAEDLMIGGSGDNALEILFNTTLSVQGFLPQVVLVGSAAQFVASASGTGPLSYQWLKGGTPLNDGGSISGAQTPILHIDPATFPDAGSYSVQVTDACSSVTSVSRSFSVEFADVPLDSEFHSFIIDIAAAGITAGCGGANYCPTSPVRRDQMAVFLLRSEHGAAYNPPPCTNVFADVPCPSLFADWVVQLAAEGITAGCNPGLYCPDQSVSRAQMAIFLLKTKNGSGYTPPPATGIFGDVPVGSFGADFIEELYNQHITGGCSDTPLLYCPNTAVLRQQMATFLVLTFF